MNRQQVTLDRYGYLISDWTKIPSPPENRCDVHGEIGPESITDGQGKDTGYEFAILVQSTTPAQDDDVSKLALSDSLEVELTLAAPDSEYGVLRIAGNGTRLNLLFHRKTYSFAHFAQSCLAANKLTLKIRPLYGMFIPHTIDLNDGNVSLANSLADAARYIEESSPEAPVDCFGAVRNFDFYCRFLPALTQPGGGHLLNALDTIRALELAWLARKAAKMAAA
ncbi:hypothetical protein [Paraburkholderia sp. D1E]|uniref:hypothetical protein n=1 Tax=Paraburkholderia sp. D1E TaxID=3461398 RepID=UPI004045DF14